MADDLTISRFSDAEFERMIGAGAFGDVRVELRGGIIHRMSPQHLPHARIKADLSRELDRAIAGKGHDLDVLTEVSVGFGGGFMPLPDIAVWCPMDGKAAMPGENVALIVEVADTTLGDDLGAKLVSYAQVGVVEYWVADVSGRVIHQCWTPSAEGMPTARSFRSARTSPARLLAALFCATCSSAGRRNFAVSSDQRSG